MASGVGNTKKYRLRSGGLPAQAIIEYALILPLLLLLVLGAMDLGRMFYTKMVLTNSAREAVNYLAYNPDDANHGYVETFAALQGEANSSTVVVTAADVTYSSCCTRGLPVEVTITKNVDLIFDGFLQTFWLISGPVEVTSTVQMMVQ